MADIPLDFGTLEKYGCFIGSAAVIVLSDKDDVRDAALLRVGHETMQRRQLGHQASAEVKLAQVAKRS